MEQLLTSMEDSRGQKSIASQYASRSVSIYGTQQSIQKAHHSQTPLFMSSMEIGHGSMEVRHGSMEVRLCSMEVQQCSVHVSCIPKNFWGWALTMQRIKKITMISLGSMELGFLKPATLCSMEVDTLATKC